MIFFYNSDCWIALFVVKLIVLGSGVDLVHFYLIDEELVAGGADIRLNC